MKRLSIAINDDLESKIRKVAKAKNMKISQLLSNAAMIYLMLQANAPQQSNKLDEMIHPNQMELLKAYDNLGK